MRRQRERQGGRTEARPRRLGKLAAGAGAALGTTAFLAPVAQAETLVVDSNTDTTDLELCDAGSDCTLREATIEANAGGPDADTITFAAGVTGEITLDGEELEIYEEVTISGPGSEVLTISGANESRILYINADDDGEINDPVTISGLTLTGGSESASGGAIHSIFTGLTVSDLVFTNNDSNIGGALYHDSGSLSILNSTFTGNEATQGGAIYVDGDQFGSGEGDLGYDVLISDSVFVGNTADAYTGGGIYIDDTTHGSVLIERTTVAGNDSFNAGGGIIFYGPQGDVTIQESTISGNTSGLGDEEGTTDEGGAGVFVRQPQGDVLIQSSTIAGNTAEYGKGGGVYLYNLYDSEVTIRNSTIAGNTAPLGGGVYRYGFDFPDETGDDSATLSSTIVADNSAPAGPDLAEGEDADGSFDLGFSLIENGAGVTTAESPAGSNIFGIDPQLGPLASNGGPTQTQLPAPTSPALDKGIANGLTTDQRGLARVQDLSAIPNGAGGDGTDIGAVELQATDCQGASVPKLDGTSGDDTLTGTEVPEAIFGLAGNDTASGGGGNDCVNGDQGKDRLKGGPGKDIVKGGAGKDRVAGGGGKDKLKGNAGKDQLKGGGGADRLSGAGGKDRLNGGGGKDRLKGGPGKDVLKGGGGKDRINCGGGKDKVTAQAKDKVSASCEKVVEKG
jgi:Ca2+-binding RTX toxin-like protein